MKKLATVKPTIEISVIKREVVSAKTYLETKKTNPASIKRAKFVPPKIGSKGFGGFEVEYRIPKLAGAYE